jgi:hypothetical protein
MFIIIVIVIAEKGKGEKSTQINFFFGNISIINSCNAITGYLFGKVNEK